MKQLLIAALFFSALPPVADDPGRINAYVTPYYDSAGPRIRIGKFGAGLATTDDSKFVATIEAMKRQWSRLNFVELYVAAIQLYDRGYRNEATYWFYSAQYRGRLFALLVDQNKMGSIGSPGFELYHAQGAFFELVGPDINGYAFGDVDNVVRIVKRVQQANRAAPDMRAIYPGIAFSAKAEWPKKNAELNAGLGKLADSLTGSKSEIGAQRTQNGTQARFARLTSKPFPGGL